MRRSKHGLSSYRLLTCDMGQLVPIGLTEVLPGDTFQHSTSALIRVAPMVAPVMHPVNVRISHWYIPHRLVWDKFEDFITGGPDGNGVDPADYPTVNVSGATGSLADYLGVPAVQNKVSVSALPFRSYAKVFNEWYRDQDLVPEIAEDQNQVQNVARGKDYFTLARPFAQKGSAIEVPLVGEAPVKGIGMRAGWAGNITGETMRETDGSDVVYDNAITTSQTTPAIDLGDSSNGDPQIFADLSQGVYADVETIRRGFALQRYQEARARYGSRFTEYLRYLGVRSSDARLQRPELLGSGRSTIAFSEVLQTAPDQLDPTESFVGDLKGHGIAAVKTPGYRRFFEEHGFVLTLMSVRPKSIYVDALHRKFLRRTKEDYWQRELEILGQQEVKEREIYGDSADETSIFGYVDRYREYREDWSKVCGEFRELLNYWHMARDFDSQPVLNEDFIKCVPTKRIHAVQTNNVLYCMVSHKLTARRLVKKFAKPGTLS